MALLSKLGRGLLAIGLLATILAAAIGPALGLRDLRYPPLVVAIGYLLASYGDRAWFQRERIERFLAKPSFPWILTAAASFVFVKIKILDWMAGRISGTDFSHLDYAIWSTAQGRFMQIPFLLPQPTYNDMFGNHYSPILLLFAGFRYLFDSPVTSLVVHALSLSLPIPLLHGIARKMNDRVTASLLTLAYMLCGAVANTLQYDIHHESFYVLGFALIYFGYYYRSVWLWLGVALTLSIKEDAGIYLAPILLLNAYLYPERRKQSVALAVLSLAWLVFVLKVAMPMHQPVEKPALSLYFTLWSRYGNSYGEAIKTMLTHPHWVARDLLTNFHFYKNLLPWGFLPFLTPLGLAILPPALVLVTSNGIPRVFGLYYGITLAPLCFIAASHALRRFRRKHLAAGVVLALASLIGGSYLRFPTPSPAYAGWATIDEDVSGWFATDDPVWVQAGLLPFLPYATRWKRLDSTDQFKGDKPWPVLVYRDELPADYLLKTTDELIQALEAAGYEKVREKGRLALYRHK